MISEFEQRLSEVLGGRLPQPFRGRVEVAPGGPVGAQPSYLLGVRQTETVTPDIGSRRREAVGGSKDFRRVLRLKVTVGVEVRAGQNQGREQQMRALDAALYALNAEDFGNGSALAGDDDRGFLIKAMQVVSTNSPLAGEAPADDPNVSLTLAAEGLFWPVGVAGEAGVKIGDVRVRGALLPLEILPPAPAPVAGGPPVTVNVGLRPQASMRLSGAEAMQVLPLPFGVLAVGLFGPGRRPAAGTISGGAAGKDGARLIPLTGGGELTFIYTPPAKAALEELVVALDDGEGALGVELGRFPLKVKEA